MAGTARGARVVRPRSSREASFETEGQPKIPRYFAFKLPIAVDEQAATLVYVDAGQSTDRELRARGIALAPLRAALRARTFAVHIVAVGTGAAAADRAAPC